MSAWSKAETVQEVSFAAALKTLTPDGPRARCYLLSWTVDPGIGFDSGCGTALSYEALGVLSVGVAQDSGLSLGDHLCRALMNVGWVMRVMPEW